MAAAWRGRPFQEAALVSCSSTTLPTPHRPPSPDRTGAVRCEPGAGNGVLGAPSSADAARVRQWPRSGTGRPRAGTEVAATGRVGQERTIGSATESVAVPLQDLGDGEAGRPRVLIAAEHLDVIADVEGPRDVEAPAG